MDPARAQSTNTLNSVCYDQPAEREPPPDEVAERRFCQKCTKYIEHPPYMVSRCCGHTYHDTCCQLMTREVTECSVCKKASIDFQEDAAFSEEVKKYDWSLFYPVSLCEEPTRDQADHVAISPPAKVVDDKLTSAKEGEQRHGQSRQQDTPSMVVDTPFGQFGVQNQEDALDLMLAHKLSLEEIGTVMLQRQKLPLQACAPRYLTRPSRDLDILSITNTFLRILVKSPAAGEVEGLSGQQGYDFLTRMITEGAVPKWTEICNKVGVLPGKQMAISDPDNVDEFFTAMQQHLDPLVPGQPFFITFVCSRPNPITGISEEVSPVVRIIRHPSSNNLVLLFATGEQIPGRDLGYLVYEVFENSSDLAKYFKFLALTSEASQVIFVRPTKRGEVRAEDLDNIDVRGLSQQYPPCDLGAGKPVESDRKLLLAIAQSLGMKRIRKEDARKIAVLDNITRDNLRNYEQNSQSITEHLNQLGFGCFEKKVIPSPPELQFTESMIKKEAIRMICVQEPVVVALKQIHGKVPAGEKCYIQIQLHSSSPYPEEILLLACDTDQFYLVNMKNKAMSTQCTPHIEDVCNYCQVFMSGCHINEACISGFISGKKKKLAE